MNVGSHELWNSFCCHNFSYEVAHYHCAKSVSSNNYLARICDWVWKTTLIAHDTADLIFHQEHKTS